MIAGPRRDALEKRIASLEAAVKRLNGSPYPMHVELPVITCAPQPPKKKKQGCDFKSATLVLSHAAFPCPTDCADGIGGFGGFVVVDGDINDVYELGNGPGPFLTIADFFNLRIYEDDGPEGGCTGDATHEERWDMTIGIQCFENSPKPLGFFLSISRGTVGSLYIIYDVGNSAPEDRFDFGETVFLPGPCGGRLTVTAK